MRLPAPLFELLLPLLVLDGEAEEVSEAIDALADSDVVTLTLFGSVAPHWWSVRHWFEQSLSEPQLATHVVWT